MRRGGPDGHHGGMTWLELRCPNGCDDGLFEALNAPLIVDRTGRYVEHRPEAATYVCVRCQSVAIDVAAAAREMRQPDEGSPETLLCVRAGDAAAGGRSFSERRRVPGVRDAVRR